MEHFRFLQFSKGIIFLILFIYGATGFNPFMDNELHKIEWVDKSTLEKDDTKENEFVEVITNNNEKYKCRIPEISGKDEEEFTCKAGHYTDHFLQTIGETHTWLPSINSLLQSLCKLFCGGIQFARKQYGGLSGFELVQTLFSQTSCSYRIESYWTYELCHGRHLRQYHENKELTAKKPQVLEFFLGYYKDKKEPVITEDHTDELESRAEDEKHKIETRRIESIDLPYFTINMTDGTVCELTNKPRQAKILYVCQPEGRGEIYEFKETSTCEYEVIILTSVLCSHPDFKPKTPPVSTISCHAVEGSPLKPQTLVEWEKQPIPQYDHQVQGNYIVQRQVTPQTPAPKPVQQPKTDSTLGDTTDKQVLREFLSGDYCFQGGSGWWKHEFCFNKHARQFHDDNNGRIVINLGYWSEAKHLEWIGKNPSKMPKPKGARKQISLLYTGGDKCDITGRDRIVEVRLRCVEKKNQPHSVSIYLMEPKTCEYILGIESPLLCNILDRADDTGIIRDFNV